MSTEPQAPIPGAIAADAPLPTPADPWSDGLADGVAMIRARARGAPYAGLGLALGLGVLVGGGMWRVLARSLVGAGARFVVAVVVPALFDQNQNHHPEA